MLVAALPADIAGESVFGLTRGQLVFTIIIVVVAIFMYASGWATRDMVCGCRTEQADAQRAIRRTLEAARRLEQARQDREARNLEAQNLLADDRAPVIPPGAPVGRRHRAEHLETDTRRTPVRHRARDAGKRWGDR